MPNEIFKLLGPTSVVITWLVVTFMIYKWGFNKSLSISKHAAANRPAYLTMMAMESITLPMFFLFVAKWVTPTLNLPVFFTACVGIAASGLLIGAWIPDVKGWKNTVHEIAAYGAAITFIPASTALYLSPNLSPIAHNIALIVLIYEVVSFSLFISTEKAKTYHLYIQAAYIFLFDISVLAAVYIVK